MTQRERVMAGCLVGAVVVFGGYKLVKSQVVEPRRRLIASIGKERARRDDFEARLNAAEKTTQVWQTLTQRTLHADWAEAGAVFRRDVTTLLDRNKLITGDAETRIGSLQERVVRKGAREGFVEVSVRVEAVCDALSDLVDFLRDLYQRPYFVRVDSLTVGADNARGLRERRGRRATGALQLKIRMMLTTLVLPKAPNLEHATFELASLDDPDSEQLFASAARLRAEDIDTYSEIARVNFFKAYEPPPAKPKPKPEPEERPVARKPTPTKPPPPDPRRDADKWVLTGVARLDDGPIAYVLNTDDPLEPPSEYRLNDEADDGRVVLLVPEGIVIRVTAERGGRQPPKNYFYPLGCNFKEREEVNPAEHPEIARMLRLVLKQ